MNKRIKLLQFSKETRMGIAERDKGCLFCKLGICMQGSLSMDRAVHDIMHIVNKSQGGLGIEENGIQGCRWHHNLLDNGNQGLREEMQNIITEYMTDIYPGWDRKDLVYKK